MTEGVDYMNTQASATEACIRSNGKLFVCRYYDNSGGTSPKILDAAEANSLHANGLTIITVYQTCGGSPLCSPSGAAYFTYAQGEYDAHQAKAAASRAGQPLGKPIYFAVDYDATQSDLDNAIVQYFNGAYNAMGGDHPLGVYGSYRVIEHAAYNWLGVPWRWQTYAWSGGLLSQFAHVYQSLNGVYLCNIEVDLDTMYMSGSEW